MAMDQLVSRTKILPPRHRADLLSRPRLLDALTDLLDYELILLVAPAGYGKTYTLMDLCRTVEWKSCWYSVTSVDSDVSRFVAHFIASLRQIFPTFGEESSTALSNFKPGQDEIEQLVIPVVNELHTHAGEHFVFVVDDYHLVDENEDIGLFVSTFVQHVDENCHIILSSRILLNLPELPLLVARGLVAGLDYEDLEFRADELQTLVLQNYNVSLPEAQAADIVHNTEGWITGMMLSAETSQWDAARRLRTLRGSGVGLYDYLAEQVLDRQDPLIRTFLLHTSVMDEFDEELCEQALLPEWLPAGRTWNDLINEVEQNNLFVMPVGDEGMAIRYHQLFQAFLRDRLVRELPEDEQVILLRLTDVYAGRNDWEMAHMTAQQHDDLNLVVDVVERSGLSMVRAGRFIQVEQWLKGLPPRIVRSRPNLVLIRGYSQVQSGNVAEGLTHLSQAVDWLENSDVPVTSVAQALAYRSIANGVLGNYDEALLDSRRALALLSQKDASKVTTNVYSLDNEVQRQPSEAEERVVAIRALALHNQGVSLERIGQPRQAAELLREALVDYENLDDTQNIAMTLYEIAISYSDAGRHGDALRLFERALTIWQEAHNVMGQALVLNSIGVHYHDRGDYQRAFEAFVESLACARRSGYTRLEAFALAGLGDVYSELELWQAAHDVYQQAYKFARRIDERFLILHLELVRAVVAWSIGDWGVAYDCLDAAGLLVLDHNSNYEWGLYRLAMGRYYLARHNAPTALGLLEEACRSFEEGGQQVESAKAHLYLAAATQAAGDTGGSVERLAHALGLINALEVRHPLVIAARGLRTTLPVLERGDDASSSFTRLQEEVSAFEAQMPQLWRTLRRKTAAALPETEIGVPKIAIRALGRTEVYVNGTLIPISKWKTTVSRDIFLCFLAFPDGFTKEQIGLLFWPDCSQQQLKTRFKNAIYRLRNALDLDVVLFEDSRYRLDRSLDYEYDVEQFLGLLDEASNVADTEAQVRRLRAAVDLYVGDYLVDVDTEWAQVERERLYTVFVESALSLAQLCFERDALEETLQVCQRLLSVDACLEEVHRLAMRAYAVGGNRAAVARQYTQCQQALEEEFAAPPSPQTEQLYALLMA